MTNFRDDNHDIESDISSEETLAQAEEVNFQVEARPEIKSGFFKTIFNRQYAPYTRCAIGFVGGGIVFTGGLFLSGQASTVLMAVGSLTSVISAVSPCVIAYSRSEKRDAQIIRNRDIENDGNLEELRPVQADQQTNQNIQSNQTSQTRVQATSVLQVVPERSGRENF